MTPIQLTVSQAIIATLATSLVILCERAFPFVLFSKKEPPAIIRFIEKYIPPMVMSALVIYCLKDFKITSAQISVPTIAGILVTAIAYKWKHNSLVAIFGGTVIYMIIERLF